MSTTWLTCGPTRHQPFVGQSAFAHKGGTHVNAVLKNVDSYQHVDPELIAATRPASVSVSETERQGQHLHQGG